MPVDLLNPCYCPAESKMQLLFRLNQNLVTLFTAMAENFEGVLVNPNGCGCTEVQVLAAINQNIVNFGQAWDGGGGTITELLAGSGISITDPTGPTPTISASAGGGTANYATATNNSGNTTITPDVPLYALGLTIGGVARTSILILDTAGRGAGDRIRLDITLPATGSIVLEVRNATSGGTLLLPTELFPSQQFTTDGVVLSATWDFVFTGTAWRYELSSIPA